MNTHKTPSNGVVQALIELDNHLIALALHTKLERQLTREDIEPLLDAICAQHAAVKGNRPDTGSITWADLRLALVGTLRICLAHLEGVPE